MTEIFIQHCIAVYKALDERATVKAKERVFAGSVVETFKTTGISQTYYGSVFNTLEDVGAIEKIQRGGRDVDTVIVLKGLPKKWPEGLGWKGKNLKPLTEDTRYATLLLEVEKLKELMGGIDVKTALLEHEDRITKLERIANNGKAKK